MQVISYRDLLIIVWKKHGVEVVHPVTERTRKVKSIFAAKWRIGRAQNLAGKIGRLV